MCDIVLNYSVDSNGKIVSIEGPWDEFAAENDGMDLNREQILGANLFKNIAGSGTREVYRTMHRYLLENPEESLEFDYRCDSPGLRRDMQMKMKNQEGLLRYSSAVVKISSHDQLLEIDYTREGDTVVVMCAWCKRIKYPDTAERWHSPARIFELANEPFMISHGICPDCCNKFPFLDLGTLMR